MSKFTDTVKQDTPRLAVMYKRDERGEDLFQWGTLGRIPLLAAVGALVRAQGDLQFRAIEDCDQSAFVIAWVDGKAQMFVHSDIPLDPLLGMLEVIKSTITDSHVGRRKGAEQVQLLGPDGKPMRG